jgi:flagellar FliL protein
MAEKKPEAAAESAPPKKKGKLLLFIIIGVVVLVLIAGGAAFMLMKKAPAEDEEEGDVPAKVDKSKKKKKDNKNAAPPAFYKFDKPFTVKLQAENTEAYLQVDMQVKLLDLALVERVKSYDPEIKHKVTLLLLSKKSTDLNNPQGVQKLSNEIRDTINDILEPELRKGKEVGATDEADPEAPVQMVLFTTFIVQ